MTNAAATPSSGISTATMKLLVDTASQRVLFAEAGKDVVDFLFSVLAMPMGGVASLLRADNDDSDALGSVVNVYASAEKMDAAYMQGTEARDALVVNDSLPVGPSLRLVPASSATINAPPGPEPAYPYYPYPYMSMSDSYTAPPPLGVGAAPQVPYGPYPPTPHVPYCTYLPLPTAREQPADRSVGLQPPPDAPAGFGGLLPPSLYRCHACHALGSTMGSKGFVQSVATYTVMDDLTVTHASNMSTVALLGRIGVKDLGALEEKTVTIGRKECLEIVKVSLRSKTVLTDVFLAKTKKRARTAGDDDDEDAAYEDAASE